jgi:hypothetical protein
MAETVFPKPQADACFWGAFCHAYRLDDEALRRRIQPYALLIIAYLVGVKPLSEKDRSLASKWRSHIGHVADSVRQLAMQ